MKNLLKLIVVMMCIATPQLAFSNDTGWVNVLQVGGQISNMFIVFSQTVGTDQSCPSARLIIASGTMDVESQKRFYAAMLYAMATGAKVDLAVSGCYSNTFPTMLATDYWFVQSP